MIFLVKAQKCLCQKWGETKINSRENNDENNLEMRKTKTHNDYSGLANQRPTST